MKESNTAKTIPTKHVFLDIVGFTSERSVEAQSEIIVTLNEMTLNVLADHFSNHDDIIMLPTGDGMNIVLLNIEEPFDIHLIIPLELLAKISIHNEKLQNEIDNLDGDTDYGLIKEKMMRMFQIRIGVNSNVDNLITDINNSRNIAGAGINMAQRIMSQADAGQIFVGQAVYDTLRYREKYMNFFKQFSATIKHGIVIDVFQFRQKHPGLNIDAPSIFKQPTKQVSNFTRVVAYYFAFLIKHKDFIRQCENHRRRILVTLFWTWACDAAGFDKETLTNPYYATCRYLGNPIKEQFEAYAKSDFSLLGVLKEYICSNELANYGSFFEANNYGSPYFVSTGGVEKLNTEHPDIIEKINSQEFVEKWGC